MPLFVLTALAAHLPRAHDSGSWVLVRGRAPDVGGLTWRRIDPSAPGGDARGPLDRRGARPGASSPVPRVAERVYPRSANFSPWTGTATLRKPRSSSRRAWASAGPSSPCTTKVRSRRFARWP